MMPLPLRGDNFQLSSVNDCQALLRDLIWDSQTNTALPLTLTLEQSLVNCSAYYDLQQHYPALYQDMLEDNQALAHYLEQMIIFLGINTTLFEALDRLKVTLLRHGGRVTGNHNNLSLVATNNVTRAYSAFANYLTLLEPDEDRRKNLCDDIKDISAAHSLSSIIEDLLSSSYNCVEKLANDIQLLLINVDNEQVFQRTPSLDTEAFKQR